MSCPKCNSIMKKLTEEGAYCISCGFVFYGKLRGSNALEIEHERLQQLRNYLQNCLFTQISISSIANELGIPSSIVKDLINQLMNKHEYFLNVLDE